MWARFAAARTAQGCSNAHVAGGDIQGDSASTFFLFIGGLVGLADNSQITGSRASGNVSNGGDDSDRMGGLVGAADGSEITESSASGSVSDGGGGTVDYMGGLVGRANNSQITESSASGNVSDGGLNFDYMGGLVGFATSGAQITGSRASGNVSGGGDDSDRMGGLVGAADSSQITGSSASGNVSDGGDGADRMGGLVGQATNSSQITGSRASGNVSDGGVGDDDMGGLVGFATTSARITGSRASGNVSGGGDDSDRMGGLVGDARGNSRITGSRASGNVSDGGDDSDRMGGLVGYLGHGIVRDSLSLGEVCDGLLATSCAAGDGADNIGLLIGRAAGQAGTDKSEVYNCLAAGATTSQTSDNTGFFGLIQNGTQNQLNAAIVNNRFDTEASGVTAKAGGAPGGVTIADLSGITGAGTEATQPASAWLDTDIGDGDDTNDSSSWLATRWLFAASAYPRLLYFNYDPANPTTENPTASTTIDVCETVTGNDPLEDQGEENMPDCGDVLEAWPRAQE